MNTISKSAPIEWVGTKAFVAGVLVAVAVQSYSGVKIGLWYGSDRTMGWLNANEIDLDDIRTAGGLEAIPDDADMNP